ncbi:hypothetical protein F5Y16DRAFT_366618 [Xylariaceae sp. FL0255]|nr:hypothetical protein F5Y16DRAFT_366618 [Xylariaceae sp. FL0255]
MSYPSDNLETHPTPAQAYELAVNHAVLIRALRKHPEFKYQEPPTAYICKVDPSTSPGLYFVTDLVEKNYVEHCLPLLPAGATRKCKELSNPWAYADPNYQWEWTWDAEAGAMKDASGNVIEFPRLSPSQVRENVTDMAGRGFIVKKIILENETDTKAQAFLGGRKMDFGEEARAAAAKLPL